MEVTFGEMVRESRSWRIFELPPGMLPIVLSIRVCGLLVAEPN
jgi:hypothetical protein